MTLIDQLQDHFPLDDLHSLMEYPDGGIGIWFDGEEMLRISGKLNEDLAYGIACEVLNSITQQGLRENENEWEEETEQLRPVVFSSFKPVDYCIYFSMFQRLRGVGFEVRFRVENYPREWTASFSFGEKGYDLSHQDPETLLAHVCWDIYERLDYKQRETVLSEYKKFQEQGANTGTLFYIPPGFLFVEPRDICNFSSYYVMEIFYRAIPEEVTVIFRMSDNHYVFDVTLETNGSPCSFSDSADSLRDAYRLLFSYLQDHMSDEVLLTWKDRVRSKVSRWGDPLYLHPQKPLPGLLEYLGNMERWDWRDYQHFLHLLRKVAPHRTFQPVEKTTDWKPLCLRIASDLSEKEANLWMELILYSEETAEQVGSLMPTVNLPVDNH